MVAKSLHYLIFLQHEKSFYVLKEWHELPPREASCMRISKADLRTRVPCFTLPSSTRELILKSLIWVVKKSSENTDKIRVRFLRVNKRRIVFACKVDVEFDTCLDYAWFLLFSKRKK